MNYGFQNALLRWLSTQGGQRNALTNPGARPVQEPRWMGSGPQQWFGNGWQWPDHDSAGGQQRQGGLRAGMGAERLAGRFIRMF